MVMSLVSFGRPRAITDLVGCYGVQTSRRECIKYIKHVQLLSLSSANNPIFTS